MQRARRTAKADRLRNAAEYLESGMTITAWSVQKQINHHTLNNWLEEYRRETKADAKAQNWLEFAIPNELAVAAAQQTETIAQAQTIRIKMNGVEIEVTSGFDEASLVSALKAVRSV